GETVDVARSLEFRLAQPVVPGIPGPDLQSRFTPRCESDPVRTPGHGSGLAFDPGYLLSGLRIPDPDQAIRHGTGEPPSVRAPVQSRASTPRGVPNGARPEGPELSPSAGVPDADCSLVPESCQALAIGSEGDVAYVPRVPG